MPETTVVTGLNGTEIIEDFLNHIRTKLRRDCNLRDSDSYTRGYSAKVNYKLELYGMDTTPVEQEVVIGTENPEETEKVPVVGEIIIPVEPELNIVRERSGLEEPVLSTDSEGKIEIKKRKYTRRIISEAAPEGTGIAGGAQEFVE